jgi:hypothetical protein
MASGVMQLLRQDEAVLAVSDAQHDGRQSITH